MSRVAQRSRPMMTLHYESKYTKSAETRRVSQKRLLTTLPKEAGRYKHNMEVITVYHEQHVHLLHVQTCQISSPNLAQWWHS